MRSMICIGAVLALAGVASADVYNDNFGSTDTGGDLDAFFANQGFFHLDIMSVTVTNDATNLYFDIQLNADIDATAWGKYVVRIDTGRNAGVNNTDPGSWNRNVDWGRGITDFLGTWADDGGSGMGGELRQYDGANWGLTDATYLGGGLIGGSDAGHAAGVQSVWVNLAALGIGVGDTIEFDVFSTGGSGGDPGVDHLSRSDASTNDWAVQSVAGTFLSYTIVPAPGAGAVLGLAGLAGLRRRR
jgi:hypothetical protein